MQKPEISADIPDDVPDRDRPAGFSAISNAWVIWIRDGLYPFIQSALNYIEYALATIQAAIETILIAAASTNAQEWTSGGHYDAGDPVWSPLDFNTYRAKTDHSGLTTDPSLDNVNWGNAGIANVQTAAGDITPGRILTNGAHGLGGDPLDWTGAGVDLDNPPVQTAFALVDGSTVNGPGLNGALLVMSDGTTGLAIAGSRNGNGLRFRPQQGGIWGPYQEIYQHRSIVGTVSDDVSGNPTGAIIERGGNGFSNTYVKLADGTQICTLRRTGDAEYTWPFPAVFAQVDGLQGSHVSDNSSRNWNIGFSDLTTSEVTFQVFDADNGVEISDGNVSTILIVAIGRWKT